LDRLSDEVIYGDINWIIIVELGTTSDLCENFRDLSKVLSSRNVNGFRNDIKRFWRTGFSLVRYRKNLRIL
jgi:hypothetical protein